MAEFVGGFIDPEVITQLQKRADIYKKKTGRTPEDLQYMNSRNAWVRVISSVDVINPITSPERITFNSTDSKNFVLSNLSSIKTDENNNLSYKLNGGIDFTGKNPNKAYTFSEDIGVRPKPGITSFSVTSKGRFGTIREANVSFNVWSRDDLDAIERVYFRPGYSCIVEWGHTIYVDNAGKVQTDLSSFNSNLNDYFDSAKTFGNIFTLLNSKTKDKAGNHQSFLGFIKNFNWSFRQDGGYDCSISIISQGEILESLKMTFDNAGENTSENQSSEYEKSIIHKFLGELRKSNIFANRINKSNIKDPLLKNLISRLPVPLSPVPGSPSAEQEALIAIKRRVSGIDTKGSDAYFYFTLRTLIYLINEGYAIKTENCKEKIGSIEILSPEEYFTFGNHFSADPLVCLLPKDVIIDKEKVYSITPYQDLYQGTGNRRTQISNPGKRILDILITDVLVERALESSGDSVMNFLNFILSEITIALGSINEFNIIEDPDTLSLEIRDQAITPNRTAYAQNSISPVIPLSGIQSLLTNLQIQSKISKDLASMIAIAAQAGPSRSAEDTNLLTQWNAGLQDRFAGNKTQNICNNYIENSTGESVTFTFTEVFLIALRFKIPGLFYLYSSLKDYFRKSEPTQKSFLQYAKKGYRKLFISQYDVNAPEGSVEEELSYNREIFSTLLAKAPSFFREKLYVAQIPSGQIQKPEDAAIAKGVIPVELSFTTDGIGGIKIGQAFKVSPGVLPRKYDEFGYIVTGLDHSIENNRWYTTVKSQLFVIPGTLRQDSREEIRQSNREFTQRLLPLVLRTPPPTLTSGQVEGTVGIGTVLNP
jgi:hypothetical protein